MDDKVKAVNKQLRKCCQRNGLTLIQNTNVSCADLNRGGLRLNNEDIRKFFKHFVDTLVTGTKD